MSQHAIFIHSELEKPTPREPRSPRHTAQIQTQNRRREYLGRNNSYFDSLEHEFASTSLHTQSQSTHKFKHVANSLSDPVLYERLVKRFQTPAEREAERKTKGYGRTLEADLLRGESKLSDLAHTNGHTNGANGNGLSEGEIGPEGDWERPATNREDGLVFWKAYLEDRFVKGDDEDFDYDAVDTNEDLDIMVRKDAEDAWFDDEEPSWIAEAETPDAEDKPPRVQGETGVQDF